MKHTKFALIIACLLLSSLFAEATGDEESPGEAGKLLSTNFIENVTSSNKEATAQMKEICGTTPHVVLCERAVIAQTNDTDVVNPKFVLLQQVKIMFGVTVLSYTDYLEMIQMKENYENKATKIFMECMEAYAKAGKAVREAIKSCGEGDIKPVASHVRSALKLYETCEAKFEDAKVITPMKETNNFLTKLAVNSIAIAEAM